MNRWTPPPPETLYDRRWAQTLMNVVLGRLAGEIGEDRFETLKSFLVEERGAIPYEAASKQLGVTLAAVTSTVFRMRARFRALMLEEIAQTVGSFDDVESEIRHLRSALGA